jgi:predicted dehydrogenase
MHDENWQQRTEIYVEEGGNLYTKTLDRTGTPAPSPYQEFVSAILEKRQPIASAEHGIKVQMILDGLYASAAQGTEMRFD